MSEGKENADTYVLGRSEGETERLILAARYQAVPLRRLFIDAGLLPRMRVLDAGSGAGDVAFAVAEVVGSSGEVVGVDTNGAILETARRRSSEAGLLNVSFLQGDVTGELPLESSFDAVVGRRLRVQLPDPAGVLRYLARYLKPGGIVAFQELDSSVSRVIPPVPLAEKVIKWMGKGGLDTEIGLKLHKIFMQSGLVPVEVRAHNRAIWGKDHEGYASLAGAVRSLVPVLVRTGLATEAVVGISTLAERLRDEVVTHQAIIFPGLLVDAWARKP